MVKEPGLSTTVTGLEANTAYLVQVAACNAVGMSAWSVAATVRTDPESLRSGDDGGSSGGGGNGGSGGSGGSGGGGGGNGGSGGGGNGGNGDGGGDIWDPYAIVILGTCSTTGEWVGHSHKNDSQYWGGTVECLTESRIDAIDPTPRGRMWTKTKVDDHKHKHNLSPFEDFTDEDYGGSSCNTDHVAAHASHNVRPCT